MNLRLPEGSKIKLKSKDGYDTVTMPPGKQHVGNYLMGMFAIFWLGGWLFGWTTTLQEMLTGGFHIFLLFWWLAWTVGGILVVLMIYRLFQQPVGERLKLRKPELTVDTGIPPFETSFYGIQKDYWKNLFPDRKVINFSKSDLKTIRLKETDSGNRLTIDAGAKRHEIGKMASEVEREWLFDFLLRHYPQARYA